MDRNHSSNTPEQPVLAKLIGIAAGSIALTLMVIFIAFLPNQYGIDPTGFGEVLGFNKPTGSNQPTPGDNKAHVQPPSLNPARTEVAATNRQETVAPDNAGAIPETNQEIFTLTIAPKQKLIFQFDMERDYELDYHWATEQGEKLYSELRGQTQGDQGQVTKVFGKLKESRGKGFFIAPFAGRYTLDWENSGDHPVVVRLNAKGFYKVVGS